MSRDNFNHDQYCRCGSPCKAGFIDLRTTAPRRGFFRHTRRAIAIALVIMIVATFISYN
jgi:hypothetical protein